MRLFGRAEIEKTRQEGRCLDECVGIGSVQSGKSGTDKTEKGNGR